jgi:hypothetical protein
LLVIAYLGTLATAAIQKRGSARTALPRVKAEKAQDISLQKSGAIDSHRSRTLAGGTHDFVR